MANEIRDSISVSPFVPDFILPRTRSAIALYTVDISGITRDEDDTPCLA